MSYRPLTGIVRMQKRLRSLRSCYRPPYGDCTYRHRPHSRGTWLSPPLRGLYTKYITKHRKTEEPDG